MNSEAAHNAKWLFENDTTPIVIDCANFCLPSLATRSRLPCWDDMGYYQCHSMSFPRKRLNVIPAKVEIHIKKQEHYHELSRQRRRRMD